MPISSNHSQKNDSQKTGSQKTGSQKTGSQKILILSVGYGLFFILTIWAAYNNQLPLQNWLFEQLPYYDKIGHVVLYCIPTYLGHRLLNYKHWHFSGIPTPVFPSLFGLFTITEELIQGFSPNRTLDLGDLICSAVGVVVGYWLAQRQRPQPQKSEPIGH